MARPLANRSFVRRWGALLAAVAYLAAAGGFPLSCPGVRAVGDSDEAFPCQHHACGCHDAQQCWHDCCCFSPRQRLAWAESHHVVLPRDVRRQLSADRSEPVPACCAHKALADDAAEDHDHDGHDEATSAAGSRKQQNAPDTVFGNLVRHCRGIDSTWLAGVPVLPVAPVANWCFDAVLVEQLDLSLPLIGSVVLTSDTPPPRA